MNKAKLLCFLLMISLSGCQSNSSSADNDALCQSLSGTWSGTYSDPSGLFSPQPQKIRLSFLASGNEIVGKATADNAAVTGDIWARCEKGRITELFLGDTERCGHFIPKDQLDHGIGHFAPTGEIKDRQLTLYLPYENAMTQTDFIVHAKKISKSINPTLKKLPKLLNHFCRENLLQAAKNAGAR